MKLIFAALLALSGVGSAGAQALSNTGPASPYVECLTPLPGAGDRPAYPQENLDRKDGGSVKVQLRFTAPDRAPQVKELNPDDPTPQGLIDAVLDFAKQLRLPCMPAEGEPVTLQQVYVFTPNDGRKVMSSQPEDEADAARAEIWKCLRYPEDKSDLKRALGLHRRDQAKTMLQLRFTAPDAPPEITMLATSDRQLAREAARYSRGIRLPCMGAEPLATTVVFAFFYVDGARAVLKDVPLLQYLQGSKLPPGPAFFSLDSMGCPFDLRVTHLLPHKRNRVDQFEPANPDRRAFMDWIAQVEPKLDKTSNTLVLGDSFVLSVPCGKIDL